MKKNSNETHKILIVVLCEEVLQAAGPVAAPAQQAERPLLAAHVAVPRVLLDGGVRRPLAHQQVHALHAEAPARTRGKKTRVIFEAKQEKTSRSLFLSVEPGGKGGRGGKGCDGFDITRFLSAPNAGYISRLFVAPRELQCHPKPIKNPSASRTDAAAAESSHLLTGAALSLEGRAAGCTTQLDSPSIVHTGHTSRN